MKGFGIIGLTLLTVACGFAQAPPNDYFTNRIALTGPVAIFGGDTAGATWPDDDELGPCPIHYCWQTVWWSWTAQDSTPVIIERLGESTIEMAGLSVYASTNLFDMNFARVCEIDLFRRGQYAIFRPQAGQEYAIQIGGSTAKPVAYRLTITGAPTFRLQPRTQTVSSGQSVLFSALAVGAKPISYQWQKDGVDILNATNHMLPMDNCSPGDAAGYRVVATSATGVSTSAVARLTVVTTESAAVLRALPPGGSNTFQFQLTGEEGRDYRIEFSTDLLSWGSIWAHGVIHNTNLATTFQVVKDAPAKFVRVSPYRAASEPCINNLRQLRTAAWLFAEDHHLDDSSTTTLDDLSPYLAHAWTMRCPSGWSDYTPNNYCIVNVITRPACVNSGYTHVLEEE